MSHLLFTDDSLLFFEATSECASRVKDLLKQYCDALGQRMNTDKSSIYFIKGVSGATRLEVKNVQDVHNEVLLEKYFF